MESVINRSEHPFTKPLIVIVMMAIVLLGAMTLAHAVKRRWIVSDGEPIDGDNIISVFPRKAAQSIDDIIA